MTIRVTKKRRRRCAHCKQKLVRRTGRGRARSYCSPACKQRAYRARMVRRVDPMRLMRQDMRQLLEKNRLKHVVLELFKEWGVLDLLEKLGAEPPKPQPPQLHLVKSPPNDKTEE